MATSQILHESSTDNYYNLGSYHRAVTTRSKGAQKWFDRGLIWTYAFNHEEAAKCFEKAISCDESCSMAYWGLAYCLGPNYNKPWEAFDEEDVATIVSGTHHAVAQAKATSASASPVEISIINALQFRYQKETPSADFAIWNEQYAAAMSCVYNDFPDDLDVTVLYADAMMNLTPWQLWDLNAGIPAKGAHTLKIKQVLEKALATQEGIVHPGLLHLYIHLMEMSALPEAALTVAHQLRDLVPDSGHLNHMPTHIDVLCGDYQQAISSNSMAIRADQKFLAREGPLNFYTLYRCHDYHFKIYAAMFSGQSKIALKTSEQLAASIPQALLRVKSPPMADWLEGFMSTRLHVLTRFGFWREIFSVEMPQDEELYCVTIATIHYARGIAFAVTGKTEEADAERNLFLAAVKRIPSSRTIFNNKCIDILAVASAMLDGELAYRQGNFELAFKELRRAIELDDGLPYDEPWGWMQPTRHAYSALLLEQDHVEEAAEVYKADLYTLPRALRHPNNVWALHGYHECLTKLGRKDEAEAMFPQLERALEIADVRIRASCFCRVNV